MCVCVCVCVRESPVLEASGCIHHTPSRAVLTELQEASVVERRWMMFVVVRCLFIYVFNCVLWVRTLCNGTWT